MTPVKTAPLKTLADDALKTSVQTSPEDLLTGSVKTSVKTPAQVVKLKVVGGAHSADEYYAALKSKVAAWVATMPLNQSTSVVQRDLAEQLGVSQKAVFKGLKVLAERKLVKVLTTSSGTVVTGLR
jgi:hypothetical protein